MRRLVDFYVTAHNYEMPRSAFTGQTPDQMYYGRGHGIARPTGVREEASPGRAAEGQSYSLMQGLLETGTDNRQHLSGRLESFG